MSIEKEVNEYKPNNNNSNISNNSTQKYVSEAELYDLAKKG